VLAENEAMTLRWRVAELEAKEKELHEELDTKFGPAALEPFKQQTDVLLRRKLGFMEVRRAYTSVSNGCRVLYNSLLLQARSSAVQRVDEIAVRARRDD